MWYLYIDLIPPHQLANLLRVLFVHPRLKISPIQGRIKLWTLLLRCLRSFATVSVVRLSVAGWQSAIVLNCGCRTRRKCPYHRITGLWRIVRRNWTKKTGFVRVGGIVGQIRRGRVSQCALIVVRERAYVRCHSRTNTANTKAITGAVIAVCHGTEAATHVGLSSRVCCRTVCGVEHAVPDRSGPQCVEAARSHTRRESPRIVTVIACTITVLALFSNRVVRMVVILRHRSGIVRHAAVAWQGMRGEWRETMRAVQSFPLYVRGTRGYRMVHAMRGFTVERVHESKEFKSRQRTMCVLRKSKSNQKLRY